MLKFPFAYNLCVWPCVFVAAHSSDTANLLVKEENSSAMTELPKHYGKGIRRIRGKNLFKLDFQSGFAV